jgi:hypothetical protein
VFNRLATAALMMGVVGVGGSGKKFREPEPPHPCGNPDCEKTASATYCSAECRRYFKEHFRAVDGRNVRV